MFAITAPARDAMAMPSPVATSGSGRFAKYASEASGGEKHGMRANLAKFAGFFMKRRGTDSAAAAIKRSVMAE